MESIIQAKFEQNDILMKQLIDTGNSILINGNNKQETYWGETCIAGQERIN